MATTAEERDVFSGATPKELQLRVAEYGDRDLFKLWNLYRETGQDAKREIVTREMGRRELED